MDLEIVGWVKSTMRQVMYVFCCLSCGLLIFSTDALRPDKVSGGTIQLFYFTFKLFPKGFSQAWMLT